jgi:formamidopyrimidine-DNA glycosylase
MPELPEVETVVRGLRQPLIGRTVVSMWQDWPRGIGSPPPEQLEARIIGQTFQAVNRRAKYILAELDHDILVIHLKMTGRLYVVDADAETDADRWVHFKLGLDNGQELRFSDMRKFGKVYLTSDFASISPGTAALGPEPLESTFTAEVLRQRLQGRKTAIKALLLDQGVVAGVGNIYADEALFRSGIHPQRRPASLSDAEIAALYSAIVDALRAGIDYEGASISWYRKPDGTPGQSQEHFYAYGRDGQPCLTCGTTMVKIRVAQRGTHYCPACQRESSE